MADLNRATIIGRISRDTLISRTAKGVPYCTIGLASNRYIKKDDGKYESVPEFFSFTWYGDRAEKFAPYLVKGQLVAIEGRLGMDVWERNGVKNYRMVLRVTDVNALGPLKKNLENGKADDNVAGDTLQVEPSSIPEELALSPEEMAVMDAVPPDADFEGEPYQ